MTSSPTPLCVLDIPGYPRLLAHMPRLASGGR